MFTSPEYCHIPKRSGLQFPRAQVTVATRLNEPLRNNDNYTSHITVTKEGKIPVHATLKLTHLHTSEKMNVYEGTAMSRFNISCSRWRCVISLSGGATRRGFTSCRSDISRRYNSSTTRNPHSVAYGRSLIVSSVLH